VVRCCLLPHCMALSTGKDVAYLAGATSVEAALDLSHCKSVNRV